MWDIINKKKLTGLGNWFGIGFTGDGKVKDHSEVPKLKNEIMHEKSM